MSDSSRSHRDSDLYPSADSRQEEALELSENPSEPARQAQKEYPRVPKPRVPRILTTLKRGF